MFRSKTLFIVGAGASKEVGLPIGAELKTQIASSINLRFSDFGKQESGDPTITDALRQHTSDRQTNESGDFNTYCRAAQMLRDAMPLAISIDNFIDAHRGDEKIALVGKLGIARCILEAERNSRIYIDNRDFRRLNLASLVDTWLSAFFQLATENVSKADVEQIFEDVSFITFNYDRCIEHFLVQALKPYYNLNDEAAQKLVQQVSIIHPYGQVGCLPWQIGSKKIAFGGNGHGSGDELLALSSQVKTFTERIEDEAVVRAMRRQVEEAETIVFLGFAYHQTNLDLIAPETPSNVKRIFGTAKGMSESDTNAVAADLPAWLKRKSQHVEIKLRNDLTCAQLFVEFWRSIPRALN